MKCIQCGKPHNRKKFCSNKCKDKFHNIHNPRGKFVHLKGIILGTSHYDPDADCHPFSEEALGQS